MDNLFLVAIVLLVSGILGGLINFFLADPNVERQLTWWQNSVIGLGASLMVPLFLNMISSNLIDTILGNDGKQGDLSKLFVLAGFCLVASISSRAFISSLTDKILKQVKDIGEKADKAQIEAADAKAIVEPLIENETNEHSKNISSFKLQDELDEKEQMVLGAFTKGPYTMRSLSGIAKDTGFDKAHVNELFTALIQKGYVKQRDSDKGPKWYLSVTGRESIQNSSKNII